MGRVFTHDALTHSDRKSRAIREFMYTHNQSADSGFGCVCAVCAIIGVGVWGSAKHNFSSQAKRAAAQNTHEKKTLTKRTQTHGAISLDERTRPKGCASD